MVVAGFLTYLHPAFLPGWGWILLEIVCGILLLLLAFGATFATWIVLQAILCSHYYEKLARHVELQLGMRSEDLAGTVDTLFDLFLLVSVNVGCSDDRMSIDLDGPQLGSSAALGVRHRRRVTRAPDQNNV
jgi:hypothetical protein